MLGDRTEELPPDADSLLPMSSAPEWEDMYTPCHCVVTSGLSLEVTVEECTPHDMTGTEGGRGGSFCSKIKEMILSASSYFSGEHAAILEDIYWDSEKFNTA